MKRKTSVTLSEELLKAVEAEADVANRSAFIEQATWECLRSRRRAARDKHEIARINSMSVELNQEALDAIEYQIEE